MISLIKQYWYCFYKDGAAWPIRGYEFSTDTGNSKPVCCRQPTHGFHESKIVEDQLKKLWGNGWTRRCQGPWGYKIVLTVKPHQESVEDIVEFIWRMRVSYRALNKATTPCMYPIPQCADTVEDLELEEAVALLLWFLALDCRQGFAHLWIRFCDQAKTAFFTPDGDKECYQVMPFSRMDAPTVYTAIMYEFKKRVGGII